MKDKISHVHARAVPYAATPRRPLHAAENATFTGRSVRQATNPACNLPQYITNGKSFEECNEYIGTIECVPAFRAFYVSSSGATCAKVSCDTGLPNIRKADPIQFTVDGGKRARPNDTRCFITIPPEELTYPPTGTEYSGRYRNIPGTVAYGLTSFATNGYTDLGFVHDVDNSLCYAGSRDEAVARQIQQEIGITAAIGATAAACLLPTPTAVIAAGASTATVTGLAVTLGLAGSAAVIGGAAYAGYKFVQYCKTDTQVTPDVTPDATIDTENTYRNYEDAEMNIHGTPGPAPARRLDNPFGPPLQNTSQI